MEIHTLPSNMEIHPLPSELLARVKAYGIERLSIEVNSQFTRLYSRGDVKVSIPWLNAPWSAGKDDKYLDYDLQKWAESVYKPHDYIVVDIEYSLDGKQARVYERCIPATGYGCPKELENYSAESVVNFNKE